MSVTSESFNNSLYSLLKTKGYSPIPKDNQNKRTDPADAQLFKFTFRKGGKDYGTVWVTVDSSRSLVLYYGNDVEESPRGRSPESTFDDSWYGLKKHLKQWAMARQLSFSLRNRDELSDDMRQRGYIERNELAEAYLPVSKQSTHDDSVPTVKIIIQHSKPMDNDEPRYRHIERIFLQNTDGEKFLVPTKRPKLAHAYARHIAEGGVPNDERWNHIKDLCGEMSALSKFRRAMNSRVLSEELDGLVEACGNRLDEVKKSLKRLSKRRGYGAYFGDWTPSSGAGDAATESVEKLFEGETNDHITAAIPYLAKLVPTVPSVMPEVEELKEWAENIVSSYLFDPKNEK